MEITRDMLLARKKEYEEQVQFHSRKVDAYTGALQDVEYWLRELEKETKDGRQES